MPGRDQEEYYDERGRGAQQERDVILPQGLQMLYLDGTNGKTMVLVGPIKYTLGPQDKPVVFNPETRSYDDSSIQDATFVVPTATQEQYLVLDSPASEGSEFQPGVGGRRDPVDLDVGSRIVIHGPAMVALWPGQTVNVIDAHDLRTNEYLVAKVVNATAAKASWQEVVVQRAAGEEESEKEGETPELAREEPPELVDGQRMIITGNKVSRFMPSTGIEVVPDEENKFVRQTVTLKELEFCKLDSESGETRFVHGPAVVFPRPDETFVSDEEDNNVFRAFELNENMGVYVVVTREYTEGSEHHGVGEELFITGPTVYYPRPEHNIITYRGKHQVHYAIAIPRGEARYVLDRTTGQIRLERGEAMFLPDPRKEVIVRRILTAEECNLWFPGNQAALLHNSSLRQAVTGQEQRSTPGTWLEEEDSFGVERGLRGVLGEEGLTRRAFASEAVRLPASEGVVRKEGFTEPRQITLDTKFDGAVGVSPWPRYAIMVMNRLGNRKVVVGHDPTLLEFDETLMRLRLSKGMPKDDDEVVKTVYLRVMNNRVRDQIDALTKDQVFVKIIVAYRVNFIGDTPEEMIKWFDVEDYVKLLTEHGRSRVRAALKSMSIETFFSQPTEVIRDTILGEKPANGKRPGLSFPENEMIVYDVEVLDVTIGDNMIASLLVGAEHNAVKEALETQRLERDLEMTQRREEIARNKADATTETKKHGHDLAMAAIERDEAREIRQSTASLTTTEEKVKADAADHSRLEAAKKAELARSKASADQDQAIANAKQQLQVALIEAQTNATVARSEAITPDLIAAMQAYGDKALVGKLAETMAPLAILGGVSVVDVAKQMLGESGLAQILSDLHLHTELPSSTLRRRREERE